MEAAATLREEALDLARQYVTKDRNSSYGDPEDNFKDIAEVQRALMRGKYGPDVEFDALDVVFGALSIKLGRLVKNPLHLDSWVDIIGYAACAYEIAKRQAQNNEAIDDFVDMLDLVADDLDSFPDIDIYRYDPDLGLVRLTEAGARDVS